MHDNEAINTEHYQQYDNIDNTTQYSHKHTPTCLQGWKNHNFFKKSKKSDFLKFKSDF